MAMKRGFGFWASAFSVLILGVCIALFTLDLRPVLAPWLGRAVGDTLGRDVAVNGPVRLGVWLGGIKLVAQKVHLANASWGSQPDMMSAGRVEVRGRLAPLFMGKFVVEELVVAQADILLETDFSGLTNRPRPGRLALQDRVLTQIALEGPHRIRLKNIHLAYQAPDGTRPFETDIERAELRPVLEGLKLEMLGTYRGSLVALDGTIAEPSALIHGERTRVELAAAIGNMTVLVAGGLGSPWRGPGFDLRLDGKATDFSDFGGLIGLSGFPKEGPIVFTANLKMKDNLIDVDEFSSAIGDGNLVGAAHARFDDDGLASLEGVFASEKLDLALVGGAWLAPLAQIPDLTAPWPLDWLRHVKLDLSYQADGLTYQALNVTDVDLRVLLDDGVLTAYPLSARIEGTPADLELAADFSLDIPSVEFRAAMPGLPVDAVIARSGFKPLIAGTLDVAAELRGHGTSPGAMLASLEGNGAIALASGRLEPNYVSRLPAEWREALKAQGEGAGTVELSCAKSQVVFGNGYATSRMMFADTASATTAGAGTLDLSSGTLDILLVPEPKLPAHRKAARSYLVGGVLNKPEYKLAAPNARAVPRASSSVANCRAAFASGLVLRLRDPTLIDAKTYEALRLRGEDMSKYSVNQKELETYRKEHPELAIEGVKAGDAPGDGE